MNSSVRREPCVNVLTNLSRSDLRSGGGASLSAPPRLYSSDILSTSERGSPKPGKTPSRQYRAPWLKATTGDGGCGAPERCQGGTGCATPVARRSAGKSGDKRVT